jgi:hypothetical protein
VAHCGIRDYDVISHNRKSFLWLKHESVKMETVMIAIKQRNIRAGMIIALAGCLLLFWVPLVAAQKSTSEMSVDEAMFIQGTVKRISLEKKLITVKPSKAERIKIQVDEQTDFVGMSALEELEKGQQVKIWYTVIGDENRAVKVERLPDLGC